MHISVASPLVGKQLWENLGTYDTAGKPMERDEVLFAASFREGINLVNVSRVEGN